MADHSKPTVTSAYANFVTELAARLGPAPLFEADADAWSGVYRMHLDAARAVDAVEGQPDLNQHLVRLWTEALDRIAVVGARNAELSVAIVKTAPPRIARMRTWQVSATALVLFSRCRSSVAVPRSTAPASDRLLSPTTTAT